MEKRRHPRLKRLLFAAAKRYSESGELEEGRIGVTLDVSEGGMMVMTESPLPFLARLDLFLGFGDQILKIKGEVTRLEKQAGTKTLMGIRFVDLDEESLAMLKAATAASPAAHEAESKPDME
jgi:hypothetical protein